MGYKNLIKAYPNNSTASANKEAASSSSETLTAIVLSGSYYNRFRALITYLRQDMLKGNNNYPGTSTSAYDILTRFSWSLQDVIIPSAQETNGTGKILGAVVEGNIHFSNTPHHRLHFSFQVLTAALHIAFSVSIVISGDIMRISYQNSRETGSQITQDEIWHELAGVLHKAVVAVQ